MSPASRLPIAPGALIELRDAVWRVLQVDRNSGGSSTWRVVGVSEIVRDQEAVFVEDYEREVRVLDPATTALELDRSLRHRDSLLYMESLLRAVPPHDDELHVGHLAAMDVLPFQLQPARMALSQTRARILIADAVGLGKTLEAGILLSELIRRGKGRRILVVTVKSMLSQFQKELWARFSIPLVRLDSVGLHRIQSHIPTNHNPFHYYDRAIISVDTLKQNNAFRVHVEKAHWDVIVIDEAHNVAERGGKRSQRAKLAQILADRSDALIMLSATPHDGKARSFASLMNMLDPTAIADPEDYSPQDIEGLFVRRFKKDVADQIHQAFPERTMLQVHAAASKAEEAAFRALAELDLRELDQTGAQMLYRTSLVKSLFSSPVACARTLVAPLRRQAVRARLPEDFFPRRRTGPKPAASAELRRALPHLDGDLNGDIEQLAHLAELLEAIGPGQFSKYQRLLEVLRDRSGADHWSPRSNDDRLVIFSERIETLEFLQQHLKRDLKLKDAQIAILHGGLSDVDQQHIVEDFGMERSEVRLLLASDVASEGLNLHYLSHRLIHFDVPWSLMAFQQRNGRIDRYGQERVPRILYLLTDSTHPTIAGDRRILELLIERDQAAERNIGDPSALMGVYDVSAQEAYTASLMEAQLSAEEAGARLDDAPEDFLAFLLGDTAPEPILTPPTPPFSLFEDESAFFRTSLERLSALERVRYKEDAASRLFELTLPPAGERRAPAADLRRRFRRLPLEVLPDDNVLLLTPDTQRIQQAIHEARREESAWPRFQYLWPLSPVVGWLEDKAREAFGRHTAPVLTLRQGLDPSEAVVVVSGLIPNRRGQPLVHRWLAVHLRESVVVEVEPFEDTARALLVGRPLHNAEVGADLAALQALIPLAVAEARSRVLAERERFETQLNARLNQELTRLEALRERQLSFITSTHDGQRQAQERHRVDSLFDRYLTWVQDAMSTEPEPFLQVIAVLRSIHGYRGDA